MSLVYKGAAGLLPVAALGVGLSVAAHVAVPAAFLARAPEQPPEIRQEDAGVQGAILFDLSDVIAAPSEAGEDSTEVAEAVEAPTVTESPEAVDPAQAADEPLLNQTPYDVTDDELKFGVAAPDPANETQDKAYETAQEYEEEKVDQNTSLGATAADASQASVSGVEAEATADKATASSEGLTAEQLAEITEWQKAVVLRIAKAKSYPSAARKQGLEGEVRVKFTLDRYGVVVSRAVAESSGHGALDEAALKVFDEMDKLPTPPNHLVGDSFTLMIPLNYRIKKG